MKTSLLIKFIFVCLFVICYNFHEAKAGEPGLLVKAKGTEAGGEFAHFKVIVNGSEVGDATTASDFYSYDFFLNVPDIGDVYEIKIVFDNDATIDGDDRNLFIESLDYSTGWSDTYFSAYEDYVSYRRSDGRIVDYGGIMPWNGELIFSLRDLQQSRINGYFNNLCFSNPCGWQKESWHMEDAILSWEEISGVSKSPCISIEHPGNDNDSRWNYQKHDLIPGELYTLKGWIKGENIEMHELKNLGANLSVLIGDTWKNSNLRLFGTFDWTEVELEFIAPASGSVVLQCRLGHHGNTVTGKAWFDNITLGYGGGTTKIEIENNYYDVADVGTNGSIKIKNYSINSNEKGVSIPDKGDKIEVSFEIFSVGQYKLRVWLRSGNATMPTSYFNPDYTYQFDIREIGNVNFVGDESSILGPFSEWGGSHWGFMEATVNFADVGYKMLGIEAKHVWQAVDYLEIERESECVVCEGDITLSSQAEVDAFNCTEVTGNLIISGSDITNLDRLSSLHNIQGSLTISGNSSLPDLNGLSSLAAIGIESDYGYARSLLISGNDALTNIDGLSSVTSVGNIYIGSNNLLESISGLSSLTNIRGSLNISSNNSLPNLDGLSALKTIGMSNFRYDVDGLTIRGNHSLTNIDGLSSLTSIIGWLSITDNNNLETLDGLKSLTSVGVYLGITDNPALTSCCGLFPLLDAGGVDYDNIEILNNGAGCTEADILEGGPCDNQTTTKIEIEDNYSIVSDVGANGAIKIKSFPINSNGKGVAIPDVGDKINVAFNIPSAGQYELRVWLRSGNATMPTSYFNPDYSYEFDISGIGNVTFTGVPSSVEGPFTAWGGSHWGFMEATVTFSSTGAKTLGIMAKYVWQVVDYIEIIPLGSSARIADFTADNTLRLKDIEMLHIYPNPTEREYNVELKNATEGLAKLVMYDLYGRKVLIRNFSVHEILEHQTIDVSNLNKGVYIVSLTTRDHFQFTNKIVVE